MLLPFFFLVRLVVAFSLFFFLLPFLLLGGVVWLGTGGGWLFYTNAYDTAVDIEKFDKGMHGIGSYLFVHQISLGALGFFFF